MPAPILTVTLNPAVDTVAFLPELVPGDHNRIDCLSASAGGKGINVARALRCLGREVDIYAVTAGATGERIRNLLAGEDFHPTGIRLDGENRDCLVLVEPGAGLGDSCRETLINGQGPFWTSADRRRLRQDLFPRLQDREWVVVSGSLPPSLPVTVYQDILKKARQAGARTVLDAAGDHLVAGIAARPFLVKPNRQELVRAFELPDDSLPILARALEALEEMGVSFPVVSLGPEGALARYRRVSYRLRVAPAFSVITTGCGDAFVAGLIHSLATQDDPVRALKTAAQAARANLDDLVPGSLPRPRRRWTRDEFQVERFGSC